MLSIKHKRFRPTLLLSILPLLLGAGLVRLASSVRPEMLPLQTRTAALVVTKDGKHAAQGTFQMGRIDAYDLATRKIQSLVANSQSHLGSSTIVAVPGTHLIATTGGMPGENTGLSIALYDLDRPQNTRVLAAGLIAGPALAASPRGDLLAGFNGRGQLCFWNVSTGQLAKAWGDFRGPLRAYEVAAVRRNAPQLVGKLKGPPPMCLTFAPGGKTLATGGLYYLGNFSRDANAPSDVSLWNVQSGRKIRNFAIPSSRQMQSGAGGFGWSVFSCTSLAFSPDGRWIAADSNGDGVCIWDVATGALRHVLAHPNGSLGGSHLSSGGGVTFSPDSRLIAAAGNHGSVDVWKVRSGTLHRQLTASGPAVFLPDGRLLVGGNQGRGPRQIWRVS